MAINPDTHNISIPKEQSSKEQSPSVILSSERKERHEAWWHPVVAGWIAGTMGGYGSFIFEALKKQKGSGQDNPFKDKTLSILGKVRRSYVGVHSFGLTLAPVSIVQVSLNDVLTKHSIFKGWEEYNKYLAGLVSGAMGALVSAPVEHLVLTQQRETTQRKELVAKGLLEKAKEKCSLKEAASLLYEKKPFYAWTGLPPLLGRESIFGFTMLIGAEETGNWLSKKFNRDLMLPGQILAGLGGAFISHPFDVIATRKQMAFPPITVRQAAAKLYHEGITSKTGTVKGLQALWAGGGYRAGLFTTCVLIIGNSEKYFKSVLQENNIRENFEKFTKSLLGRNSILFRYGSTTPPSLRSSEDMAREGASKEKNPSPPAL